MLLIIIRRLGQSVIVLFLIALISFLIFRYVGNPADNLLGQEATLQQRAALEEALGLNDPIYEQYFTFVWKALHFDFGNSYRGALPVAELILSRLPATLELAFTSAFFAIFFGVTSGIYTAIRRRKFLCNLILSV
jgi:peptide/nickel transport system permease protein